MFNINDTVVYGAQGVCTVTGIAEQLIGGETNEYYVLKSKADERAVFYVPLRNEKALAKMRRVMTAEEVKNLIDSMPNKTPLWIANEAERRETYKKILASGDQSAIISVMQAIYLNKKEREEKGKRLHISDEHFLKEAEQLLYSEWQYVLNMSKDELTEYIFARIKNNS